MTPLPHRAQIAAGLAIAAAISVSLTSCRSAQAGSQPSIEFTRVPQAGDGSRDKFEQIGGRVKGTRPGDRIVLFALSGVWLVQPETTRPFTTIQPDSTWKTSTHPGSEYAAVMVDSRYRPPLTVNVLPEKGGPVLAVATVAGLPPEPAPPAIRFSGYQ
jgi:hypothetical protein